MFRTYRLRHLFGPVCVAILWVAAASVSIQTRQPSGFSLLWPANAILAAALLTQPRAQHALYVSITAAAAILFGLVNFTGAGIAPMIGLALIQVGEATLAAMLINRFTRHERLFDEPRNLFGFVMATLLACLSSAVLAGILLSPIRDRPWWQIIIDWMPNHVFGLLIVTPLLAIMGRVLATAPAARPSVGKMLHAGAMIAMVGAGALLIFSQSSYSLAFLIFPALLIATFHLRAPGAAASVLVVSLIGSYFMARGLGPFALMPVGVAERAVVMQIYLATMFLCSLPVAAILNQRDRLAAETAQHLANITSIAQRLSEVLFHIDEHGRWSYLSPSYETLTGHMVAASLGAPALAGLPAVDRIAILEASRHIRDGQSDGISFATTLQDRHGAIRHIEIDMFRCLLDSGTRTGAAGVIRDVTSRREVDARLQNDVATARLAAAQSDLAARTDELTRLPNRRAFLERLDASLAGRRPVALALFDIDHFKRINDGCGRRSAARDRRPHHRPASRGRHDRAHRR